MKRIRSHKHNPEHKRQRDSQPMFIRPEELKALNRAIESICDPDPDMGWTCIETQLNQNVIFYDDTDDLPLWAYENIEQKVHRGQIKPWDIDERVCPDCHRGKQSKEHRDECLKDEQNG